MRIARRLERQDRPDLTRRRTRESIDELRREILAMWGPRTSAPRRPTPMEEVRSGLFIFEQTLWDAVPRYVRVLDRALRGVTGRALPLDAAPIVFGSWIGAIVTAIRRSPPEVTRQACGVARIDGDCAVRARASRRCVPSCR